VRSSGQAFRKARRQNSSRTFRIGVTLLYGKKHIAVDLFVINVAFNVKDVPAIEAIRN
jgi:hypothetical protein